MLKYLFYLLLLQALTAYAAQPDNLDFEILDGAVSAGWDHVQSDAYKVYFDTTVVNNGKVSGAIESIDDAAEFSALAYRIPLNYTGKKITLSGYLKTENVSGFAGLWMRVDPNIAFDNMAARRINGTHDWTKFHITLDYNKAATAVYLGGGMAGTGKIWIDDLAVTIDGKSLAQAPIVTPDLALTDTEFDHGSLVSIASLNDKTRDDLTFLAKVWGFLKYHHPSVGNGQINWDYELFRVLPDYLKSENASERDKVLIQWIDRLGKVPICSVCASSSEQAFLKVNHDWMNNAVSPALTSRLKHILNHRYQGDNYYVRMAPHIGNPIFENEQAYGNMPYPDDGFRLLSVFRYWNIIHYYFPYKHLIDDDWGSYLPDMIESHINAKNELEYEKAAIQMIGKVSDSHAGLWAGNNALLAEKGRFFAPFHVRFIGQALVVDSLFKSEESRKSGLQIGDVITHINSKTIAQHIEEKRLYYPASNEQGVLRNLSFDIFRAKSKLSSVTLLRDV